MKCTTSNAAALSLLRLLGDAVSCCHGEQGSEVELRYSCEQLQLDQAGRAADALRIFLRHRRRKRNA